MLAVYMYIGIVHSALRDFCDIIHIATIATYNVQGKTSLAMRVPLTEACMDLESESQ